MLDINDDLEEDNLQKRVYSRERIYFVLRDRQFHECFKFSQIRVEFILSKIGIYLSHNTNKNKAICRASTLNLLVWK